MKFTPEILSRVIAVLTERLGGTDPLCPLCHKSEWTVSDGFVFLLMQAQLKTLRLAGKGHPCITLTCNTCGNTHLLNMMVLGLSDLTLPDEEVGPEAVQPKEASVER
jgi:hypothetical protein